MDQSLSRNYWRRVARSMSAMCLGITAAMLVPTLVVAQTAPLNRTVLPIPEPNYPHSTVLDVRDAKAPPRFEIKAPAGAPNVLIVLVDDIGFGMPSACGGPGRMPTAEQLANKRLRYNQFHSTTADVGMGGATPVTADYKEGDNSFTGKIYKVTVDVKPVVRVRCRDLHRVCHLAHGWANTSLGRTTRPSLEAHTIANSGLPHTL